MKNDKVLLSPTLVTKAQREWLEKECARTGKKIAGVLRDLVQAEIDKEAKK